VQKSPKRKQNFNLADFQKSQSQSLKSKHTGEANDELKFLGNKNQTDSHIVFIDSPGISDSNGKDKEHLNDIVDTLK
jgi:predicted GTPase